MSLPPVSLSRRFRNAFLTGLLVFLPLGTTIFVIDFLLDLFKAPALRLAYELGLSEENSFFGLETLLAVAGLIIGIILLTALGYFSKYLLGRFFINLTERVLDKVPFINTVYRSVKQIVETFGKENRAVFKEVCLVEYPRKECYVLGFITANASKHVTIYWRMKTLLFWLPVLNLLVFLLCGCGPKGSIIEEGDDPAFERGRSYLKVGRDTEALDEFLSVTRRVTQSPKSHLEAGRLLLALSDRKDPVAAIYHFRRFLLLQPNAREAKMVEQLIVTAEREIIRKLPGEPYGNYLESIDLKDENDRLRTEIADLKARLGSPLGPAVPIPNAISQANAPLSESAKPAQKSPVPSSYIVQPGDSLYGISKKIYGDASHIDSIYAANRDTLKSKNNLKVGQTLRLPPVR